MTPRKQTTNAEQWVYSTPLSSGSDQRSRNGGIPRIVTSSEHLFLQRLQYVTKIHQPYFAHVQVMLVSKEQGSRLPDPVTVITRKSAATWVTVSDKSSAADIRGSGRPSGSLIRVRGGLLEIDRFRAALSIDFDRAAPESARRYTLTKRKGELRLHAPNLALDIVPRLGRAN